MQTRFNIFRQPVKLSMAEAAHWSWHQSDYHRRMFVSLTRLRLRSMLFVPLFGLYAFRSLEQARKTPGFVIGGLLPDRNWTYWTMTGWDCQESVRGYMISGAHKSAMAYLQDWCDEASVAHWVQSETALPPWTEADRRMRAEGRPSRVRNPSPRHASLQYQVPRITAGVTIRPD